MLLQAFIDVVGWFTRLWISLVFAVLAFRVRWRGWTTHEWVRESHDGKYAEFRVYNHRKKDVGSTDNERSYWTLSSGGVTWKFKYDGPLQAMEGTDIHGQDGRTSWLKNSARSRGLDTEPDRWVAWR